MTYEESALLAAIAANPADDTNRLVYADYLEEFKEDGPERATAIRIGVRRGDWDTFPEGYGCAGRSPDKVVVLARGYPGIQWQAYKGMIGACICTWERWLKTGDNLLARNWIPEVVITTNGFVRPGQLVSESVVPVHLWPAVQRWVVPDLISGVRWEYENQEVDDVFYDPADLPRLQVYPASCPQVGAVVKTLEGRSGVLITPIDARGYGCVRSEYK